MGHYFITSFFIGTAFVFCMEAILLLFFWALLREAQEEERKISKAVEMKEEEQQRSLKVWIEVMR